MKKQTLDQIAHEAGRMMLGTWQYFSANQIAKHVGTTVARVRLAIDADPRFRSRQDMHAGRPLNRYQLWSWQQMKAELEALDQPAREPVEPAAQPAVAEQLQLLLPFAAAV